MYHESSPRTICIIADRHFFKNSMRKINFLPRDQKLGTVVITMSLISRFHQKGRYCWRETRENEKKRNIAQREKSILFFNFLIQHLLYWYSPLSKIGIILDSKKFFIFIFGYIHVHGFMCCRMIFFVFKSSSVFHYFNAATLSWNLFWNLECDEPCCFTYKILTKAIVRISWIWLTGDDDWTLIKRF